MSPFFFSSYFSSLLARLHTLASDHLNNIISLPKRLLPFSTTTHTPRPIPKQANRKAVRKQHVTSKKVLLVSSGDLVEEKAAVKEKAEAAAAAARLRANEMWLDDVEKVNQAGPSIHPTQLHAPHYINSPPFFISRCIPRC